MTRSHNSAWYTTVETKLRIFITYFQSILRVPSVIIFNQKASYIGKYSTLFTSSLKDILNIPKNATIPELLKATNLKHPWDILVNV